MSRLSLKKREIAEPRLRFHCPNKGPFGPGEMPARRIHDSAFSIRYPSATMALSVSRAALRSYCFSESGSSL